MAVPQQKFREIVFQLLFSHDMGQPTDEDMLKLMVKELSVTKNVVREAQQRVESIIAKLDQIDPMIKANAVTYEFSRIQVVEKNILRLALYELCYDERIPPKVAIVEAMRLAKKFSTPESALFVNAILDAIYKRKIGAPIDEKVMVTGIEAMEESEKIISEVLQDQKESQNAEHQRRDVISEE